MSELLIVALAGVVLVTARRAPRWGWFDWIALSYSLTTIVVVFVGVTRRGGPFTPDALGTMIGPIQFLLLYRALVAALPLPEQRARAIRLVVLGSSAVAALTLLQQFDVAATRELLETLTGTSIYESSLDRVPRATGPFPHWHNLAGYLLIMVLLAFSLLIEPGQRVLGRVTLSGLLLLDLVALIQTTSIAPLLGVVVGVLVIGHFAGKLRVVVVWLTALALVGAVLFGPSFSDRIHQQVGRSNVTEDQTVLPQTIAYRYESWTTQFVPVIEDHLLLGYGPELPPRLYFPYTDSLYIALLLRGGLVLLLVYLALMLSVAERSSRLIRSDDLGQRVIARTVLTIVPILMLIDTIETYFLDSGPAPLLWTLIGLMGVHVSSSRGGARRAIARTRLRGTGHPITSHPE